MSAPAWIAHLAALAACLGAPAPLAWALTTRLGARAGAANLILAALCWWSVLAALAVVGVGACGQLTLGRVLVVELLLAALGRVALARWRDDDARRAVSAAFAGIASWGAIERLLLGAIVAAGGGAAAAMLATPTGDYDSWMYQLPQVAEWLSHGSLQARQEQWLASSTFERGILYYPADWNALFWLASAPLGRDVCALLPNLVAWAILGLATSALALRAGADRVAALAAAALVMLMPLMALNLHSAHIDLALGAELGALLVFTARGVADGCRASHWLALALAGLLVGTKMSGIGLLAAPALLAAWLWRGRQRAEGPALPIHAALATASLVVLGAWWYARNWAETGNPLGFVAMRLLGHDLPGVIDKAYIDRTNLLHAFDPLRARHWLLLLGSIAGFCAPAALFAALALPRLRAALARSRAAWALLAIALLLAWSYIAGPWSAKHASEPDLSWWMGQQLRYTVGLWAVVAALAAAALTGRASAMRVAAALAVVSAAVFPFLTYGWIVAAPVTALVAAACWLRFHPPRLGHALALALLLLAAIPAADWLRWRILNARTGGVPELLGAALPPGEPVAFWGSHQSWLLYGRDLQRPVVFIDLERCADAEQVARAMRARGCSTIALGPRWTAFDLERYRLVDDHPERFAQTHGEPRVWGMCLYRLVERKAER